jgi:hypothetical protein
LSTEADLQESQPDPALRSSRAQSGTAFAKSASLIVALVVGILIGAIAAQALPIASVPEIIDSNVPTPIAPPGPEPAFLDVSEIIMVVEDLDEAVARQWDLFGIGPWEIWTLDNSSVDDMHQHGAPRDFAIRIAYTKIGNVHWELVEPLDTHSTYYETLRDHGPSVHNIVFKVADFDSTVSLMAARGFGTYNSGDWHGTRFINFDTRSALPVVAEIFDTPIGSSFPPPEETYPPQTNGD